MSFFIGLAKTLSVVAVVLAALWMVVPKGYSAALFKYAMGLFMVAVIISTLNVSAVDFGLPAFSYNTADATHTAERISNSTAEFVIENLLNRCNIKFKEVVVFTDNSDPSDINITKAAVLFYDNKAFNSAAEIVKNQTGIFLVEWSDEYKK